MPRLNTSGVRLWDVWFTESKDWGSGFIPHLVRAKSSASNYIFYRDQGSRSHHPSLAALIALSIFPGTPLA